MTATAGLTAADHVRGKLRQLGERRTALEQLSAQLARETRVALAEAHGQMPIPEAAALAGLARSTAYDFLGKRNGDDDADRGSEDAA